jgi:hypothetical protein
MQVQSAVDEQSCVRILYHRVAYAFPGADITQIQRQELKDGTVLFVGGVDGAVQVDIDRSMSVMCIRDPYPYCMNEGAGPNVRILIPAPWAFIAYKDGAIIDDDSCKRDIITRWVLETLEKEAEDGCY